MAGAAVVQVLGPRDARSRENQDAVGLLGAETLGGENLVGYRLSEGAQALIAFHLRSPFTNVRDAGELPGRLEARGSGGQPLVPLFLLEKDRSGEVLRLLSGRIAGPGGTGSLLLVKDFRLDEREMSLVRPTAP